MKLVWLIAVLSSTLSCKPRADNSGRLNADPQTELFLALPASAATTNNHYYIQVSGPAAADLALLCLDSPMADCQQGKGRFIVAEKIKDVGARSLFQTKVAIKIAESTQVVIVAVDQQANILGVRQATFKGE